MCNRYIIDTYRYIKYIIVRAKENHGDLQGYKNWVDHYFHQ